MEHARFVVLCVPYALILDIAHEQGLGHDRHIAMKLNARSQHLVLDLATSA